jgi:transposase InsO family protein
MWPTDFNYFKVLRPGWVYLSSVLDVLSCKVIVWNLSAPPRRLFAKAS